MRGCCHPDRSCLASLINSQYLQCSVKLLLASQRLHVKPWPFQYIVHQQSLKVAALAYFGVKNINSIFLNAMWLCQATGARVSACQILA